MNVLIDTNVLPSAALRDRLPESAVLYVASHDEMRGSSLPRSRPSISMFCDGHVSS